MILVLEGRWVSLIDIIWMRGRVGELKGGAVILLSVLVEIILLCSVLKVGGCW